VPRVQIVIAVEEPALAEIIQTVLTPHRELQVVASVNDEPSAALALQALLSQPGRSPDDAVAVIAWGLAGPSDEPWGTRLILEFPEAVVYTVRNEATTRLRWCLESKELPSSLNSLLDDLRTLSAHPPDALPLVLPVSTELAP
jgi:hypothetical protein